MAFASEMKPRPRRTLDALRTVTVTEPTEPNYEDQAVADTWCAEMRLEVEQYLKSEDVVCGEISEWPAWHIAPYVSVWAIESAAQSGFVGAWVLCGDLPTDIIDGEGIEHPREAMAAIADRWLAYVKNARAGEPNDDMEIEKRCWRCSRVAPKCCASGRRMTTCGSKTRTKMAKTTATTALIRNVDRAVYLSSAPRVCAVQIWPMRHSDCGPSRSATCPACS
jgi:hypothetical protein